MNFDLLLNWMSHINSGSWSSFKRSIEELSLADDDVPTLARSARVVMSDLRIADFFVDGGTQWRMLPPSIGGLCEEGRFILTGARSSRLVEDVESAAAKRDAEVRTSVCDRRPPRIEVLGDTNTAQSIAEEVGIEWTPSYARRCLNGFKPIASLMDLPGSEVPRNWSVRSFDLRSLKWVDALLPKSMCEFTNRFGERQYFAHIGRRKFIAAGKRESVFVCAAILGVELAVFDPDAFTLSVPFETPLPESLSRSATLCSGETATIKEGRFWYSGVSHSIASTILAALGQRVPYAAVASIGGGANG